MSRLVGKLPGNCQHKVCAQRSVGISCRPGRSLRQICSTNDGANAWTLQSSSCSSEGYRSRVCSITRCACACWYVFFDKSAMMEKFSFHPGTTLSAIHFVPGQFVDVIANSYVPFMYFTK